MMPLKERGYFLEEKKIEKWEKKHRKKNQK